MSQFTVTAQNKQELYMWTQHACNGPSTVHVKWTGPPADICFSTCERDHSPRQCQKTWKAFPHIMPYLTRSYHIPCHVHQVIQYTMPHLQAIPYTMSSLARRYHIPCLISPGHTICHAMPCRPYHIPYQTSPGHTIYHAMPTRSYHIPWHTSPGHTIYYVMPDRPYHITWHTPLDNNIYHATPRQTNTYTTRFPPGYTMPYPLDDIMHHAMHYIPYHIPCHAR